VYSYAKIKIGGAIEINYMLKSLMAPVLPKIVLPDIEDAVNTVKVGELFFEVEIRKYAKEMGFSISISLDEGIIAMEHLNDVMGIFNLDYLTKKFKCVWIKK